MKRTSLILLTVAAGTLALTGGVVLAERGDGMKRGGHGGYSQRGEAGPRGMGRAMMLLETYDTDGDGALTQDEIDTARAAQLAQFDTDSDGALTLEEYQALWADAMRERMVDRFQAHDDDGDGVVTVEEFGDELARMVERMDRNADGRIDAEDMGRAARSERRAPRDE